MASFFTSQPRGLHNFISDIRNATSKEEERSRIDKELGNIRLKFSSSATLTSYAKKKYVWKMCYIYMLGYEVDFGHAEFISLLASSKYSEKSVGYMACALLLRPGDELMALVINSMRNDIVSNSNAAQCLALSVVANLGGTDLADALAVDVQRLITDNSLTQRFGSSIGNESDLRNIVFVKKKAILCLTTLYRTHPDHLDLDAWAGYLEAILEDRDLGVITSAMGFLLPVAIQCPNPFERLIPYVISVLNRLIITRTCTADYLYYRSPSPWLQCKCLKFLQQYKKPTEGSQLDMLYECLRKILLKSDVADSTNANNTINCVLFESVHLVICYGLDCDERITEQAVDWLGKFIAVQDANTRYLGLDAMTRYARLFGPSHVQAHQVIVLDSLKDADISIRKRALDLLYVMTDQSNAELIVSELVDSLVLVDSQIKEDMVVKIAILAEKFAVPEGGVEGSAAAGWSWYIDNIVKVVLMAGDWVTEAVWHRAVQIITNKPETHEYAAEKLLGTIQSKYTHEVLVALGGYVLGEFGVNICEKPGMSGYDQFAALQQHFASSSLKTQALLLTTYAKLSNLYPDTRELITDFFGKLSSSPFVELQQRACEYLNLPTVGDQIMESVLNNMPAFPEQRENLLLKIEEKEEKEQSSGGGKSKGSASASDPSGAVNSSKVIPSPSSSSSSSFSVPVAAARTGGGASNVAATFDLLSMDDDSSSAPSHGLFPSQGITASLAAQLSQYYNDILLSKPGTINKFFEDENLTINCTAEYRQHLGRISFQIISTSAYPISSLSISVSTGDQAVKLTPNGPQPDALPAKDSQARMQITVECLRPFSEPPELTVSFTRNNAAASYPLKLPISICSFFEPVPVDKVTYMQRWKLLEGPDKEAQEIFSAGSSRGRVSGELMAWVRNSLFSSLGIALATGDMDSEMTATGCATLKTGTLAADGTTQVTVGVMMRIEGDMGQQRYRITIRAKHGAVASALKQVFKTLLG